MQFCSDIIREIQNAEAVIASAYYKCATLSIAKFLTSRPSCRESSGIVRRTGGAMTRVVLIHGIGQQNSTAADQIGRWLPSLVKGVLRSEHPNAGQVAAALSTAATGPAHEAEVRMGFYGDLFLTPGVMGEEATIAPETIAVADGLAIALLRTAVERGDGRLATEARVTLAQADPEREGVEGLGSVVRGAMSHLDDNRWLSARIFGLAQRAQTDLVQVARYLTEDPLREKIQARVEELLDRNSDLIIAHSLGSIVGWEASHRHKSALPMLLTIGSPLGLDSIVYPRLRPFPPTFPPAVCRWVNIAHPDDIIAVEPRLRPLFPSSDNRKVEDHAPTSPRNHHAAEVYLEHAETGKAVSDALTHST